MGLSDRRTTAMASALGIIRGEHRDFARILRLFEELTGDDVTLARAVESGKIVSIAQFLRGFSSGVHHVREEILLPALAAKDLSFALSLDEYRKDHAVSYVLLRKIETALAGARNATGRARLAEAIREYVGHKRRHIEREEVIFLPLAQRELDAATLEAMKAAFAANIGAATLADWRAELDSLVGPGKPGKGE